MQKPGLFGMNGFMVILFSCLSIVLHGQQPGNLILIDAENKQAFTVRLGDQLYSSSGQGQLVLSPLKDSVYRLHIRFPRTAIVEQVFPITLRRKDLGFQLKGKDNVWVLYNWQNKETIHPIHEVDSSRLLEQGIKRDDGFSRLMASVVNDTAVMYNTYSGMGFSRDSSMVKNIAPAPQALTPLHVPDKKSRKDSLAALKKSTASAASKAKEAPMFPVKDSTAVAGNSNIIKDSLVKNKKTNPRKDSTGIVKKPPSLKDTSIKQNPKIATNVVPGIKKVREVSLKVSRKMVFLEVGKDGLTDTITLFVYFEKNADTAGLAKNSPSAKPAGAVCSQVATDPDLEFLRSAILKANTEQEKISLATGAFTMKCFTVGQVRLLASLFVSDKAKYRLMNAAHGHIADSDHFRELADMYTDKNFQKKFLALADKRS